MTVEDEVFQILACYKQTKPFLEQVRSAADANRLAFGFLAAGVYEEFARNDRLYVIVEKHTGGLRYAGHLLFEQRYPRAQVVQMFTHDNYRRRGIARRLMGCFRDTLTEAGFTSIYASVADDLTQANAFWASEQFYVQRVKQGGASRKRLINVRCHELNSPQLFSTSGISSNNPLGLAAPTEQIPMYLLDLNVLFDVTGPRRSRHDDAVGMFQVERMNVCRLAISKEIRAELRRTASSGKIDPMEGFVDILPSFPLEKFHEGESIFKDLASIVFPDKGELTANDKSDLAHIATAIQNGLRGLITNDRTVLDAAPLLKSKYLVEIVSPAAFKLDDLDTGALNGFATADDVTLRLEEVSEVQVAAVHKLLSRLKIAGPAIATDWVPTATKSRVAKHLGVWLNDALLGYITWSLSAGSAVITGHAAVDDSHASARNVARALLLHMVEQLPQQGPRHVNLVVPQYQSHLREIAYALGFRSTEVHGTLHKVIAGRVFTKETWGVRQAELFEGSKIKLPAQMPAYRNPDQQVPVLTQDGNRSHVTLDLLESLLSPVLLCLPGRKAVVTPIRQHFAEHLLGHPTQGSLLPLSRVSLFSERQFVCDPRTLKHFKRGRLILFYESGKGKGKSAIMWMARVREAYHKQCSELDDAALEGSVMTKNSLASIGVTETRTIVTFDNVFKLPACVSFSTLKRLGCGEPAKLQTTNEISDFQLQEILCEAFGRG